MSATTNTVTVTSYTRTKRKAVKKDEKTLLDITMPIIIMLVAVVILVLLMFWYVTLTLCTGYIISYSVWRYLKSVEDEEEALAEPNTIVEF